VNTGRRAACFARSVATGTRHRTTAPQKVQVTSYSYFLTCPYPFAETFFELLHAGFAVALGASFSSGLKSSRGAIAAV